MREHVTLGRLAIVAGLLLIGAGLLLPADASESDAPGNHGTIKINDRDVDQPGNDPHVGCVFQVDFYGFDAEVPVVMVFEAVPPTGDEVLHTESGVLDDDDASGGGSPAGLDGSFTIDLSAALASFEPHQMQGHHLKLTVTVDDGNTQGAQTKSKTFWVTDCGTTTTTTTTEPESTTTTEPESTTTTEPESTTTEPESTTTEPESTTTEPESTTTEPESTTTEPESTTTEPESTTTEAEVIDSTTEPGGSTGPTSDQQDPDGPVDQGPEVLSSSDDDLPGTGFDSRYVWAGVVALIAGIALELAAYRRGRSPEVS
jgi:hypothetical protein